MHEEQKIIIDSRINIVQYDTNTTNNDGNISINFKTVTSIAIEANPYSNIMSFYWYNGCLFTSSASSINALYTNTSSSSSSLLTFAECFPIRFNFSIPIDSSIFIINNHDDEVPLPPSFGNFEIFHFDKGNHYHYYIYEYFLSLFLSLLFLLSSLY